MEAATSDTDAPVADSPAPVSPDAPTKPVSARPPRPSRPDRRARRQQTSRPNRRIETAGPDPATPLAEVRLVVGTIVGTHGIHGELKVLLTTDEPEHLKTIKRVYVGEEQTPRRVLGIRFHDRYAL